MLLVITADDLGIDARRDDGILVCFARGAITQASLMVTGPSAESAARAAKKIGLPLGLHLDLTETPPSASPESVASLLDEHGNKRGKHGLRAALQGGLVDLDHVRLETLAQIEKFAALTGARPTHVDGHQHAHAIPSLVAVLAETLASAGVRTTRIPEQREVHVADPEAARFYRSVASDGAAARSIYARHGVASTETFVGLDLMGDASSRDGLAHAVTAQAHTRSVELMCHPGYVGEGGDDFNRSPARERELRVLTSLPFASLIAEGAVELATFARL